MAKQLTLGDLIYKLGFANEDEFVKSLNTTFEQGTKAAEQGGDASAKRFSEQFKATFGGAALGSFIGNVFTRAFASATTALVSFSIDSLDEFKRYELGLVQLKNAGVENIGAVQARIEELAEKTRVFSTTDISRALGELAKAGYDLETAFSLVEQGANGAASEIDASTLKFGDLTNTSKELGNILRAMHYDSRESARVMDVMSKAAQDSNLNVSDLVEILAKVGPTGRLANLEIEDLAAMAAVLSNSGMQAANIGTALRTVLQSLINPTGALAGELDTLGVSLVTRQGEIRNINDVLDGLHELTIRGGRGLQTLTQATGAFGSAAAANLGSGADEVKRFRQALDEAEGSSQKLADSMINTAAGAAAQWEAKLASARVELGEKLTPIMVDLYTTVFPALLGVLSKAIDLWSDWSLIIRGTNAELLEMDKATANLHRSIEENLGAAWLEAQQNVAGLQQAIASVKHEMATHRTGYGRTFRKLEEELEQLIAQLETAEAHLANLTDGARQNQLYAPFWRNEPAFGPQLAPDGWGATPEQVAYVGELYRSMAQIRADLAQEEQSLANATTEAEERAASERIQILKNELDERERLLGLKTSSGGTSSTGRTADPIVDEAQRVGRDQSRLRHLLESDRMTAEEYESWLQRHLERIQGLYSQATTLEQTTALLAAEATYLRELERLADEEQKIIADAEQARRDELRETEQLLRNQLDLGSITREEYRDLLQAQLGDYEEYSRDWYRVAIEINRVSQQLQDEQTAAAKQAAEDRLQAQREASEAWFAEQENAKRVIDAAYDHAVRTGAITQEQHLENLRHLQSRYDKTVDQEYWALQRQIETTEAQISAAVEEQVQHQYRLGSITREEYRATIRVWLASYEEGSREWMRLREQLHNLDVELEREAATAREQAAQARQAELEEQIRLARQADENARAYFLATGDITPKEQLDWLREQLATLETAGHKFSNEWITIWRELERVEDQIKREMEASDQRRAQSLADMRTQAEEEARAAYELNKELAENERALMLEMGQISTEEHRSYLQQRLTNEREYSNEWMGVWRELRTIENTRIQDLIAGEGELTEAKRIALIERLEMERAALDASVGANLAAIAAIDAALSQLGSMRGVDWSDPVAALEADLTHVGTTVARSIADAIQTGDIGSALEKALGSATNYFVDQMIQGIIGPIAQQLAASIASSTAMSGVAGALNPLGLVLGVLGLAAGAALSSSKRAQQDAQRSNQSSVRQSIGGAPSITYNLAANVRVDAKGSFDDPTFHARWRNETEALIISLLGKVRK